MPVPLDHNKAVTIGRTYDWPNGGKDQGTPFTRVTNAMFGENFSRGNPRINGKYVSGGSWYMWKDVATRYDSQGKSTTVFRPGFGKAYNGTFWLLGHAPGVSHPTRPSNWNTVEYRQALASALVSRGSEAWNRLKPTAPTFDLALNILELKDVPGMLKNHTEILMDRMRNFRYSRGKSKAKATGEWYLAINFGWIPLLEGYKDFVKAQSTMQKDLDQIIRDAGRPVKRRRELSDKEFENSEKITTFKDTALGFDPTLVTQCWGNSGLCHGWISTNQTSKTWAVAQFRYHLPPGPRTVGWRRRLMRRLFGVRPTPSIIYNLMPWSWLLDYFTDLGQFVDAVSPGVEDSLAADYFYLMRSLEWVTTTKATRSACTSLDGSRYSDVSTMLVTKRIIKMRMVGSPFGFGLREGDLSLKQKAILGALGLSRLPT